ncbi:hypothetical protein N7539_001136 [Penicillium diatomitis]|uniref:Required for respiratory growth protein 7, mitochondrial n=1 Tax=Penicillium diatomitis TaxID=2819901 RepID=A0A9W9XNV3_9EURO|nr:uncharacterized protein N7539_001136 [Penicillium diatomitis]KAJ5496020.1 hypothetical protein N7539_001136 [Penicillium diatomitis]
MRRLRLPKSCFSLYGNVAKRTHVPWQYDRQFSVSRSTYNLTPFTRRIFKLPSPPSPSSRQHDDLQSFLSYAERTGLPSTSTVYVGTHYEYSVLQSLRKYAFALHRIGGRDDAGIDLVGTWHLPEREGQRALRVLTQCKALKTKLGPNIVRELEGALRQAPVGWRTDQTVGILMSPREATKGVRDALARSQFPLFWMMLELDGTLKQVLWNARAEQLGLGALGVETQYGNATETGRTREIALTWNGKDIPDMDCVEKRLLEQEHQWLQSWTVDPSIKKDALLDSVEKIFPDAMPELQADHFVSAADRTRILQSLRKELDSKHLSEKENA